MVQGKDGQLVVQRTICACIIFLATLLASPGLKAQSQSHFTDFRMAPSALNPALTGAFRGTYRVNGLYRSQWRNHGDSRGLTTSVASVDLNVKGNLLLENDWVSVGLSFYQDRAGSFQLRHNLAGFSFGYHLGMDKDYRNVLSAGFSYGQLSTRVEGLVLASDLGRGQPNLRNRESFNCDLPGCTDNPSSNSMSAGISLKTELNENPVRIGLSLLHLNRPETSIGTARGGGNDSINNPNPNPNPNPPQGRTRTQNPFRSVLAFHGETSSLLSPRLRLNPAFLFMLSSGTTEFQLQSTVDYLVNPKDQISVTGGLGFRPLPNFDAAYLMGGIKIKDLTVRLSYDITLSSLNQLGSTGNSFELSVGYVGRIYRDPKVDKIIFCPRL